MFGLGKRERLGKKIQTIESYLNHLNKRVEHIELMVEHLKDLSEELSSTIEKYLLDHDKDNFEE